MIIMALLAIGRTMPSFTQHAHFYLPRICLLENTAPSFRLFEKNFIKTGEFDVKWSEVYQHVMSHRQTGDYDINVRIEKDQAAGDVMDAQAFVEEVEQWLHKQTLL